MQIICAASTELLDAPRDPLFVTRSLRAVLAATRLSYGRSYAQWNPVVELGSAIRLAALVGMAAALSRKHVRSPEPDISLSSIRQKVRDYLHRPARGKGRSSPGPEIGD